MELGQYGHSKDHRPDRKQMVVGVILDGEGRPLCCELWPGNVTDVKTLIPVVDRLQQRFRIRSICIVADRGMISQETIAAIADRGWFYILGVRLRRSREAQAVVEDGGHFTTVFPRRTGSHEVAPLQVKAVTVGESRYIVST